MKSNRNNVKESPAGTAIVGVITAIAGFIWTSGVYDMESSSSFFTHGRAIGTGTAFGILFTLVGVGLAIYGLYGVFRRKTGSGEDNPDTQEESRHQFRVPETWPERKPRENKSEVYCPYCGTVLEKDYRVCGSCGAARKK